MHMKGLTLMGTTKHSPLLASRMKLYLLLLAAAGVVMSAGFSTITVGGRAGAHARLATTGAPAGSSVSVRDRALRAYASLPPSFEANQGQTSPAVRFLSRGPDYTLFLTPGEVVMSLAGSKSAAGTPRAVLRWSVVGANPGAKLEGAERLSGLTNYLTGNDPSAWHRGVPTFGEVAYRDILPKTDLVFHGGRGALEYDFVLAPGADPRAITIALSGAQAIALDSKGNLLVTTAAGVVRHDRPSVYQEVDGARRAVSGGYVLSGPDRVSFQIGPYDLSRPLVIDPTLTWSTTRGGTATEAGNAIALDSSNNDAYFTGYTYSSDFPTTAPSGFTAFQTQCGVSSGTGTCNSTASTFTDGVSTSGSAVYTSASAGFTSRQVGTSITGTNIPAGTTISAVNTPSKVTLSATATATGTGLTFTTNTPLSDAFVVKVNSSGTVQYATYLGGNGDDVGRGIAVDSSGNAYVTGSTLSTNFPTASALTRPCGGTCTATAAFVTKLNSTGSALVWSTYLGGSGTDVGNGIAVDSAGNAYVTGTTSSADFPTKNGFQTSLACHTDVLLSCSTNSDAFLVKLHLPSLGNVVLDYSTYLGGSGNDTGNAIALGSSGLAYITGAAGFGPDFPVTPGAYQVTRVCPGTCLFPDAYVAVLDTSQSGTSSLKYSTYLGDAGAANVGLGIATWTSSGTTYAYVTGQTYSSKFPTSMGAYQTSLSGSGPDAFVTKLNPAGHGPLDLIYSSYLGGSGFERGNAIAVDGSGNAYLTGQTGSTDFPTTSCPTSCPIATSGGTYVSKLNPAGSGSADLVSSTYLGSTYDSGNGVAVDSSGNAYVTGPKSGDAYVAKVLP